MESGASTAVAKSGSKEDLMTTMSQLPAEDFAKLDHAMQEVKKTGSAAPPSPCYRYWRLLNNADDIGCDGNRWVIKLLEFYCGEVKHKTPDGSKSIVDSNIGCSTEGPDKPWVGVLDLTKNNAHHWSSNYGAGERAGVSFLGYDFTEAVSVDRFKLVQMSCTSSVQVQGSNDKKSWETIWTQALELTPPSDTPYFWEDHRMPIIGSDQLAMRVNQGGATNDRGQTTEEDHRMPVIGSDQLAMRVTIQKLSGEHFQLEVGEAYTVSEVKSLTSRVLGTSENRIQLTLKKKFLQDSQVIKDLMLKDGDTLTLIMRRSPSYRYWRLLNNADDIGCDRNRWVIKRLEFYCGEEKHETPHGSKSIVDSNIGNTIEGPDKPWVGVLDLTKNNAHHWSSTFGAGKRAGVSYLGYDFTEAVSVDRFKIVQMSYTSSVQVQGSNDRKSWETIWTQALKLTSPSDTEYFWEDHCMPIAGLQSS